MGSFPAKVKAVAAVVWSWVPAFRALAETHQEAAAKAQNPKPSTLKP